MNEKIAHVKKNDNGAWAKPHLLIDHAQSVAKLAEDFANQFQSGAWAYAAGIAHDAGKEPQTWQNYLRRKSGYDEDAHLEGKPGKIEHSCHGAKLTEELLGKGIGRLLGYCIAGHHAGLPDWLPDEAGGQSALSFRLQTTTINDISVELKNLIEKAKPGCPPWKFDNKGLDLSLWIRMLFSSLVDADFLDTEAYMNEGKTQQRGGYLPIKNLLEKFNSYMTVKSVSAEKIPINAIRQEILSDCRTAAAGKQGIFSLTVPTGGGKTLSSLAFALEHAVKNNLRRVIYVIPYTSIIEQNADVFREALGDDQVIEHHSNLDEEDSTSKARLSAENWDAPLIVTTTVQFFESLFAAKPSRCRKLHNIVGSVVVLDEAQLVPVEYIAPILQTMDLLSRHYQVSFVISTATQPAFESRDGFKGLPKGTLREIIRDVPWLYKNLKRVEVETPQDWGKAISWEDLALELSKEDRVLCVVSDRKSCRNLHKLMPKGTYHLSALMCGQHRSEIISEIKQKLKDDAPVRVISTQLVEAGVDIDFPVVYRALAGLDSIAQVAGRCNREGKLAGKGRVVVFVPPKKSPPGILRKASETTLNMLKSENSDPLEHSVFEKFFADLYWKANSLDGKGILDLLKPDHQECGVQFRTAAEKFHIIDDKDQKTILVRYGEGEKFIGMLKSMGPERWLLRKLQRYSVNVYHGDFIKLLSQGAIEEIVPNVYAVTTNIQYDKTIGLLVDEMPDNPEAYIA
jgi:CRISPR-associated endonuclease/helicase Cas3